jgi:hypothetical protein
MATKYLKPLKSHHTFIRLRPVLDCDGEISIWIDGFWERIGPASGYYSMPMDIRKVAFAEVETEAEAISDFVETNPFSIHLNDIVKVTLTKHGQLVVIGDKDHTDESPAPIEFETQFWIPIKLFGPLMELGDSRQFFKDSRIQVIK